MEGEIQRASRAVRGYLFDQYVRACGFEPTTSWVLIVHPSGDCDFTPLQPEEALWCCERAEEISATIRPPLGPRPPWDTERTWACPPERPAPPVHEHSISEVSQ